MGKFAAAINCMDGRVQMPVVKYIRSNYKVEYVDMITLPGPNKILSEGKEKCLIESIKKCLEISATRHDSKLVAIVGHYDCAGNPVNKETQISNIISAIETVSSWRLGVRIIGLWVDENWTVNLLP